MVNLTKPMTRIVNLYEGKTHLSRLVDRAASGEEVVIAKAGRPVAKLVPLAAGNRPRRPGVWKRKLRIAKNFDAPLPKHIRDAFLGRDT